MLIVVLLVMLTACGGSSTPAAPTSAPTTSASGSVAASGSPSAVTGAFSLVALGDSVPAGTACSCTPYPQLSVADLASAEHVAVTTHNRAGNGYTTDDVLHQLEGSGPIVGEVQSAHTVEVEVGANDVAYSSSCGTAATCYSPMVAHMQQTLSAVLQRLRHLTSAHPVRLVVLDYWSVWLGGEYAQAQGDAYVSAAAAVTDEVNAAIRTVAEQTRSIYVDLRAAFKGPDYTYDETHYLASDGDHPNAAGHARIAQAIAEAVGTSSP